MSESNMNISFTGKRVLVTGAGQGIGRAVALRMSQYGATVFAVSRTEKHLVSLSKEDAKIQTITVDLGDWDATRKAVQSVVPIDLLVNNAAIACLEPFLEAKPENIDASFNVNVKAVLNVSQIVAKSMIEKGNGGSIVNVSSQTSRVALWDHAVYSATKGALDMLTRAMALELGSHNIRVNAVNPTVVMTEMGWLGWSDPAKAAALTKKIPLGRFAEVDEVVDGIVYLLSTRSSMITGVPLLIDGGFVAT